MANYSTNYNLKKPLGSERYDVGVDNTNCDIIDGALLGLSTALTLHTNDGSKHPDITQLQSDVTNLNSAVTPHLSTVASTSTKGHVQLATSIEVTAGVDTSKAVTPAGVKVELDKKINHSLATAANDFLISSGSGVFVKKTLDEVKTILGLGSAAYTPSTNYAAAVHTHDYSLTSHTHDFSAITTGVVPVAQGGTGQTTLALARNAMGLGNTTAALPVANGGTGAATAAAALINLGITATAAEINILDGVTGVTSAKITYLANVTSDIQTQLNAKADKSPGVVSVTASKTLALTDAGTFQSCTSTSAIILTIPLNSAVAFPIGTEIGIYRHNTGSVSVAVTSGVLLYSAGSRTYIREQYETCSLKKIAADTWVLVGSLSVS